LKKLFDDLMESFYIKIYLLYAFITIIIIFNLFTAYFNRKLFLLKYQNFIIFLFLGLYYILISTRSKEIGSDTERYIDIYDQMYYFGPTFLDISDVGFYLFNTFLIVLKINPSLYLFFLSLLFILPIYFTITQFKNYNRIFLLWFFFSLFIFISMSTNVLRQGIGSAFVMWGISIFLNRKDTNKRFIIPFLIACFFHLSLILVIIVFFLSNYLKNIKLMFLILLISIVLTFYKFDLITILNSIPLFEFLFFDRIEGYLGENTKNYNIGFRIDFLLFNIFFVALGYYISKIIIKEKIKLYNQIYFTYILLTAYFILMFNMPFSDRFGLLSWIFIPFLVYPIFNLSNSKSNNLKLVLVILGLSLFIIFNVIKVWSQ